MSILRCIALLAFSFSFVTCDKKQAEVNLFENATSLDCNNLRVRKVEHIEVNGEKTFQVSIENTCRACTNLGAYESLYIITRLSNDTIATSCGACLTVPDNKTIKKYILNTDLATTPNMKEVRFTMDNVCRDIPYEP